MHGAFSAATGRSRRRARPWLDLDAGHPSRRELLATHRFRIEQPGLTRSAGPRDGSAAYVVLLISLSPSLTNAIADLVSLDLAWTIITPFPSAPFLHLRSLTLSYPRLSDDSMRTLPTPANCPALRALSCTFIGNATYDPPLLRSAEAIVSQLDGLQLHIFNHEMLIPIHPETPTLLTVLTFDTPLPLSANLKMRHFRFYIDDDDDVRLYRIHDLITLTKFAHPLSLHLPKSLQRRAWTDDTSLYTAFTTVLFTCITLAIPILWYDPEEEDNYAVSPSFWRYAKRIKAEAAEVAAEGVETV
jgi:hypothetical protein